MYGEIPLYGIVLSKIGGIFLKHHKTTPPLPSNKTPSPDTKKNHMLQEQIQKSHMILWPKIIYKN